MRKEKETVPNKVGYRAVHVRQETWTGDVRQECETGDIRQETWDVRQEKWHRWQETWSRRFETGDVRQIMWDSWCETGVVRQETGDKRCEIGYMRQELWAVLQCSRAEPFFLHSSSGYIFFQLQLKYFSSGSTYKSSAPTGSKQKIVMPNIWKI